MLVVDPACPEADTEPFSGSEPAVPPAWNVVLALADDVALPPVYTPCMARLELVTDAGAGVGIPSSRQRASVQERVTFLRMGLIGPAGNSRG